LVVSGGRRLTRFQGAWSSDVCASDLPESVIPLTVKVPPPKSRVVPAGIVPDPDRVPPPRRLRVPVSTWRPLIEVVSGTLMLVVPAPDGCLTYTVSGIQSCPLQIVRLALSPCRSMTPSALLVKVAALKSRPAWLPL